jgi:diguanylate cyclase (GGDEF)-like protein
VVGFTLMLGGVAGGRADAETRDQTSSLPTLTTIQAVHLLRASDAARGYPVHVRGVVTYYDPYLNHPRAPVLMVTDSTATIYVGLPGETSLPLAAGTVLDVRGISSPGDFAPSIIHAQVQIVGQAPLPAHALKRTLAHLLTGSDDAQWSEMEGVIQSVEESGNNVTLKLNVGDGEMAATTVKEPGANYAGLIDARVRIRGIAGSLFNRNRQLFGVQLLFPGMQTVHVVEPATTLPFELPVSSISDLMRYEPFKVFNHRVHLRGVVTLFWPGRLLCLQDGPEAMCAGTAQTGSLEVGQQADVVGFPQLGPVTPTLGDAVFEGTAESRTPLVAPVDAKRAFGGDQDAQLVQIDGQVIAQDKASQDTTLVLSSGRYSFPVILTKQADTGALRALQEGTKVRITGICSVQADSEVFTRHDGYPVSKYFQIMLRSSKDVVVLERPSWWTAEHTLKVLAFALAITVGVLGWVVFLRMRVKEQTELLRHQATHDGLTGVWNRKEVLNLLRREFEIAARAHSSIGVMMLDADHFKGVNDSYGHLAGDAVLQELVKRIQLVLRSFDLIGRYGGEEFLIVVPGCSETQAYPCAERIRAIIADEPIDAEGARLAVTVSVGLTILDPRFHSLNDALAAADMALYRAKNSGRNRVELGMMACLSSASMEYELKASPVHVF